MGICSAYPALNLGKHRITPLEFGAPFPFDRPSQAIRGETDDEISGRAKRRGHCLLFDWRSGSLAAPDACQHTGGQRRHHDHRSKNYDSQKTRQSSFLRFCSPPARAHSCTNIIYPHYAYVLEGTLTITNVQTGKTFDVTAGQFLAEMQDTWHYGENKGNVPVRLLIVDHVPKGVKVNSVPMDPKSVAALHLP